MALSDFARMFSRSSAPVAEPEPTVDATKMPAIRTIKLPPAISLPDPSYAELVSRVDVLAAEVSRLSRELATAVHLARKNATPITVKDAKSGRSLMEYIARQLGENPTGDTIRGKLTKSPQFATLRERVPNLTTDAKIVGWLAQNAQGTDTMRYSLIMGGFETPESLARKEARA